MSDLKASLLRRIAATGPMTVAEYMTECLLHPTLGYYTNAEVFGAAGDFTTAPEISQMFGELMGLAIASSWMDLGQPTVATFAEAGPGRGTLMADALRATNALPGFRDSVQIALVEASPRLRQVQQKTLGTFTCAWVNNIAELPEAPLFLIANEFLDALPIRQFVRQENGWSEHLIAENDGDLGFYLSEPAPISALAHRLDDTSPGELVEFCPSLATHIGEIARRIVAHGGVAILVDYGGWRSMGDTFQAVKHHKHVDPLKDPGTADLTAHVDFETVAAAATAAGAAVTEMSEQGVFLERLGITARAQSLARSLPDESRLQTHIAAHRRLTHPQEMGSLFKAIAIYQPGSPLPPGFNQ